MENLCNNSGKSGGPLPDFASAMGGYYPTPSPADSGVMSPMTPMSSYTQGSTPEQPFITSPEHLNYAYDSASAVECVAGSNPADSPYSSDEGIVLPKCHPHFYETRYEPQWTVDNTVGNVFCN